MSGLFNIPSQIRTKTPQERRPTKKSMRNNFSERGSANEMQCQSTQMSSRFKFFNFIGHSSGLFKISSQTKTNTPQERRSKKKTTLETIYTKETRKHTMLKYVNVVTFQVFLGHISGLFKIPSQIKTNTPQERRPNETNIRNNLPERLRQICNAKVRRMLSCFKLFNFIGHILGLFKIPSAATLK